VSSRRAPLALLILLAGGALWFAPELLSRVPGADELAYFQGFELSMHGASPYEAPRYVYAPVFARFGAVLLARFGFFATAVGLRSVNLGAACLLAFGAFSAVPSLRRARLPLSMLTLIAFRPLTTSLGLGNLSPLAAATTCAGVALATSLPVLSGVVLGLGLAIKPAGLPALVVLSACRPRDGSRRHFVTVGVALAVLGLLLTVDARFLGSMLAHRELPDVTTNLSPHRLLAVFRLELPAGVYAVLVVLPCALWAHARVVDSSRLVAIAGLASLLWPPRIWLHSFVFVLPAVVLAIGEASEALRASRNLASAEGSAMAASARSRAVLTATWTLLGVTCVELADALGDLGTALPFLPWSPAFNAAIPLVAAALLTRVAVRADSFRTERRPFASGPRRPSPTPTSGPSL
jgi:hypothetical protein